ncbi:MAG: serine protease [Planctomycetaceae bacterium]|jgi:hypothetical protein|nr:serine protease [Planctomycetaceae bacterium]
MHLLSATLRFITQGCFVIFLSSAIHAVAAEVPREEYRADRPLPNVVRVIAFDKAGQSFGSGSYIGVCREYGIIVTNRHVVAEADGLVHVHFPGGFSTFGAVIKSDAKWDLALVAVSKPPETVPVLNITDKAVMPGEAIWIAGYGGGKYRIAPGQCTRYLTPDNPAVGAKAVYEIMEVMIASRYGDSGGPILNVRGELAGVLFGSDMVQFTAGSYSGRVNRFLNSTTEQMQRLPDRPESFFAMIETNGPKYSLQFSSALTPSFERRTAKPANVGISLPPSKSIAIPADVKQPSTTKEPEVMTSAKTSASSVNLPSLTVKPAVWSEPEGKIGSLFQPSRGGIIQTGLTAKEPEVITAADSKKPVKHRHYGMKIFADKRDWHWTLFLAGNVIIGAGLVTIAVRLLNTEE